MPFGADMWSDRIARTEDDGGRQALLAEVGRWRASRLTDIGAARQSTYAMSRLHWLLRQPDAAIREAQQLLSLCQTPPRASGEDMQAAKGWMASLGADVPKIVDVRPRKSERDRDRRGKDRPARERGPKRDQGQQGPHPMDQALESGRKGHWMAGLKMLKDRRPSARVDLMRTWLHLGKALELEDAEACRRELALLRDRLGSKLAEPRGGRKDAQKPEQAKEPRREAKPARKEAAPQKPAEPKGPSPRELARQREQALVAVFADGAVPELDALAPLLEGWDRLWRAIQAVERHGLSDAQAARLLQGVDAAMEGDRQIPGGTSLAVRMASAGGALCRAVLTEGTTAARYGDPHISLILELSTAAHAGGWRVDRILRGPTRRETRDHPALDTLSASMKGLWRLLLRKGDDKRELWYVTELPPEGRAGVPALLLSDHKRVVVLPIDPDLLGWYGSLDAPDAIGWTGDEAEALVAALAE